MWKEFKGLWHNPLACYCHPTLYCPPTFHMEWVSMVRGQGREGWGVFSCSRVAVFGLCLLRYAFGTGWRGAVRVPDCVHCCWGSRALALESFGSGLRSRRAGGREGVLTTGKSHRRCFVFAAVACKPGSHMSPNI